MRTRFGACAVLVALVGCSNSTAPGTSSYSIGGTVAGLEGSGLVLTNNGGDPLTAGNGAFTFSSRLATGQDYDVVVATQPSSPAQVCTAQNASGTVANSDVTAVAVVCAG
jgi:hypothetical protein